MSVKIRCFILSNSQKMAHNLFIISYKIQAKLKVVRNSDRRFHPPPAKISYTRINQMKNKNGSETNSLQDISYQWMYSLKISLSRRHKHRQVGLYETTDPSDKHDFQNEHHIHWQIVFGRKYSTGLLMIWYTIQEIAKCGTNHNV